MGGKKQFFKGKFFFLLFTLTFYSVSVSADLIDVLQQLIQVLNSTSVAIERASMDAENFLPPLLSELNQAVGSANTVAGVLQAVNSQVATYGPQCLALAPELTRLSNGIMGLYTLAQNSTQSAVQIGGQIGTGFEWVAWSLQYVSEHQGLVACEVIGVIATGIVVGSLLRDHVFTLERKKNILVRGYEYCADCIGGRKSNASIPDATRDSGLLVATLGHTREAISQLIERLQNPVFRVEVEQSLELGQRYSQLREGY